MPGARGVRVWVALGWLVVLALGAGCGNRKEQFTEGRALDACSEGWPVCDRIAGCLIGDQSYVEGRFPGSGQFVVRVPEPSVVRVSIFIDNIGAAGDQTIISWFEEGCRARIRQAADGRSFVGEANEAGAFTREADLTGVGDHLIEFQSDAQADYALKVDVLPKRLNPE